MTSLSIESMRSGSLDPDGNRGGAPSFAVLGGPGARLLAGPPHAGGTESLVDHNRRLNPLELDAVDPAELRAIIERSGLLGRGGGQFPIATKCAVAAESPGVAVVVVNASEGEPASRKDRTLIEMRPHLVIDGAMVAARAIGADEIVFYLHEGRGPSIAALQGAISERGNDAVPVRLVEAPARYVAGETSAVISYLEGSGALPRHRSVPAAASGLFGRPTTVNNAETIAHLALVARYGSRWFAEAGDRSSPGSTLVTLAGEVTVPGVVAEVLEPVPLGALLSTVGGLDEAPRAVLIGGYEGIWLDGKIARVTPLSRGSLFRAGVSIGCGLVAVLGGRSCGVATTARIVRWLAGESAGQCGPCASGLPAIADVLDALGGGAATRRDLRRLRQLCAAVAGRGACGHPSGVVSLVESALDTFAPEVDEHLAGRSCAPSALGFPLPRRAGSKR
ncbi:MAG TPA: NADH-ubiquinone oxidoreductase-F iron-sulfur binding region domain-containing protein [Acidimicrobiales bacterium]|nr:NADH-ubiquinone oxidoreductase-F iron-sulfur binding region domain-containing protein [Acidimicrobiales bacterium]